MPTAELAFGHVTEACHALRHMGSPLTGARRGASNRMRRRIASPRNVPKTSSVASPSMLPLPRWPPAEPQLLFDFINQCLLMLALWSCGRRPCVVQAQRQIHRALRAALTIAEMIVRTIAEQPALTVPRRVARIDRHGSEYHSVRSSSARLRSARSRRGDPAGS